MLDLLPQYVLERIRDRYMSGVARVEHAFPQHRADEDAVTGALGQAIALDEPLDFEVEGVAYHVEINYRKIRGRGKGAPEKRYGADGIFQISVVTKDGRILRRKGLPFQSKIGWTGRNKALLEQAQQMQKTLKGGLVIDFARDAFRACLAENVVDNDGRRVLVDEEALMRPLGSILADDFLDCRIGSEGLYYEDEAEKFVYAPQHVIETRVEIAGGGRFKS